MVAQPSKTTYTSPCGVVNQWFDFIAAVKEQNNERQSWQRHFLAVFTMGRTTEQGVGALLWDSCKLTYQIFCIYARILFRLVLPPPPKSLKGEVILITGSANGIGREVCLQLADSGATLICWDLDENGNQKLIQELKDFGAKKVYADAVNVSDRSQVEEAARKIKREIGDVTIVINNAGIMPVRKFLDHRPDELERLFAINVVAHFWILREVLPGMIENSKGHIVTMCSVAGQAAPPYLAPYSSTKHAVDGYIKGLQMELRQSLPPPDIKFTTVYPYATNTGLLQGSSHHPRFPGLYPLLEPKDVAARLVDGMRRNYEYVYVPRSMYLTTIIWNLLPYKIRVVLMNFLESGVEPLDNSG